MNWTATFTTNTQNSNGDINCVVKYSNGSSSFQEDYTESNVEIIKSTINSRLAKLQEGFDFVDTNPVGTVIDSALK